MKAIKQTARFVDADSFEEITKRLENHVPLYLFLKGEYYEAFISGEKVTEYRRRSKQWNAETCWIGRPVIISKGYGKKHRRNACITGFCYDTSPSKLPGWLECYGPNAGDAACITLKLC